MKTSQKVAIVALVFAAVVGIPLWFWIGYWPWPMLAHLAVIWVLLVISVILHYREKRSSQ